MKVLPFKIPKVVNEAITVQTDRGSVFFGKLHQHEEIQISFIVSGKGTLIIGDTIANYAPNDLIIFGAHLPHVLRSDTEFERESHMISIFFTKKSFGQHFFEQSQLKKTKLLIERAQLGVIIKSQPALYNRFSQIEKSKTVARFAIFFELLEVLSSSDYQTISSFNAEKMYTDDEGLRLSDVFEYTMNHFHQEIKLDTIASIANMSKNAFCRYFKQRTNKTYVRFLNEVRVARSCRLLNQTNQLSIGEIAFQAGFSNISNFNRKFKEIKGMTPTAYKKSMG